jgi:basic membrane lipoprotein Med (substrate-binding protein (PBP1-ABC) superfamily)
MKRQGGLGRAARSQIVAGVFALTCATCLLVFADGQRAKEPRGSAQRNNPREPMPIEQAISIAENMLEGPMTVEQAKTMAENMLQSIVAVIHPADSPQVIGVPSVVPTGNCLDGVCLDVVKSLNEYLSVQPKGIHRFQFMTIASDSDDMLFAVITGGTIQTNSPSDERIQKFFNVDTVVPLLTEPRVGAQHDISREPMTVEQAISIAANMLEGPMTVEQAKTMAENMLQSIVAVIHPADSPQVIGVPSSVAPTGSCVDGVCVNVVRSNREYLRLQPKGFIVLNS